jgi:ligand-binding sensor domain-containing protein
MSFTDDYSSGRFTFNLITSENQMLQKGLSANTVYCVMQDKYGYLWFGTWDGLNKFDGYSFTTYNRKNGLSSETINSLLETDDGNLWIGTDEGLNYLNRKTDQFTSFFHDPNDSLTINSNRINFLFQDKPGRIIVCTDRGLCTFDISDYTANRYYSSESNQRLTRSNHINYIYKTNNDIYWIATNFGLVEYNAITKENIRHLHRPGDLTSLSDNRVRTTYEDKNGRIWVGAENGLNLFNPANRTFQVFKHQPEKVNSLSHNFVERIFEDSFGRFWIATDGGGLNLFNSATFDFSRIDMQSGKNAISHNERIYSVFEDKHNNLWFGAFNGVYVIDRFKPEFNLFTAGHQTANALHDHFIWSFLEFSVAEIWIGTDKGITIFNPKKRNFTRLEERFPQFEDLNSIRVRSMAKDEIGNVWIGTRDEGVFKLEIATGKTRRFKTSLHEKNSLSDDVIFVLYRDSDGVIWVGTENGLNRIDPDDELIKVYRHDPADKKSISDNRIYDILEDRNGKIWFATLNGLNVYNKITDDFYSFKDTAANGANRFFSLFEDSEGNFWIGSRGGGLILFDRHNHSFKSYTTDDGLPNNLVYKILEDEDKNLWMSANRGIAMFDKKNETFINFDVTDGLQSNEFNAQAALKTLDGKMLFGGMRGFNVFDPEAIKMNTSRPDIIITSFKKFNRPQPGQLLNGDTILLKHDENFFSFEFSALDFTNALRSKYAYILENHSREWTYVDGRKHFAEYTNVNPGKYIFKVIGSNNNGIWNREGVSVTIIVKAPWYETTLFRIFAAAAFIFLLWFFIYSRIQRGKRKTEMEKKVLQIEKQLFDIQQKALRLQMNPHFIFNSLNSIQSFVLANQTDQAVTYLSRFSQLMRLMLNNSLESIIPLSDELDALKYYLELEMLRFENKFAYEIVIDPQVDEEFTGVPPMIFQPYVENAIIHGLINKKTKGHIKIEIQNFQEGIRCIITDDGIGRKKADEIKRSGGLNTASRGMMITKERLEIANRSIKNTYSVKVTDLKTEDGKPSGTRVMIFIHTVDL